MDKGIDMETILTIAVLQRLPYHLKVTYFRG